jgi:hypothetical protein
MPSHHLSLLDLQYDFAGHFRLHLMSSKTDPFHEGYTIVLGPSGGPICPVQALLRYLAIRGPSPGPLFVCCNGSPLTPALVNSWLQTILLSAGECLAIIPATVLGTARPRPRPSPAFRIISSRLRVGGLVTHICVTFEHLRTYSFSRPGTWCDLRLGVGNAFGEGSCLESLLQLRWRMALER